MKTGLVMQGGAMRGLFTCGVIDVFMENGIDFDGAIGVSAGAVFGCNIKSKQIDRPHRYNIRYADDYRVGSVKSWLKTGNAYDQDFCYNQIPNKLDLFDFETYQNNPMEFYVGCTDVETGKPVYHKCEYGDDRDINWFMASASMPVASTIIEIDGQKLLDGGANDSIPLDFFESIGYDKNVVVLTRTKDYREKTNKLLLAIEKLAYNKKYPNLIKSIINHEEKFNKTLDMIEEREEKGEIIVIRPQEDLNIKMLERNVDKLNMMYQHGRDVAYQYLDKIRAFFKG